MSVSIVLSASTRIESPRLPLSWAAWPPFLAFTLLAITPSYGGGGAGVPADASDAPVTSLATRKAPTSPHGPGDDEIRRFPILNQQLVQPAGLPDPEENQQVMSLLDALAAQRGPSGIQRLATFLADHPEQRWSPSLKLYLAECLYGNGYFQRAEEGWTRLWQTNRMARQGAALEIADQALHQLLKLNGAWCRRDQLRSLLAESSGFPASGPTAAKRAWAEEVLHLTQIKPAQNAYCGPAALYAIKDRLRQPFEPIDLDVLGPETAEKGLSGDRLRALAQRLGLNYRWARQGANTNSIIPTPCIVHWRTGHYATLQDQAGDNYLLEDRPLRFRGFVPADAVQAQSSGYFLIQAGSLPDGWQFVDEPETATIFGRHCNHARPPEGEVVTDSNSTVGGDNCGSSAGMATYTFHNIAVSLLVRDTPLFYAPPFGPPIRFTVSYKEYDDSQAPGALRNYSNFGSQWSFNYIAFLEGDGLTNSGAYASLSCVLPNGGLEYYNYNAAAGRFDPHFLSHAYVVRLGTNQLARVLPDGSREIYAAPNVTSNPTRIYLSALEDPQGNRVNLDYDGSFRLTQVRDALGQTNRLFYEYPGSTNFYKISRITDPFGRTTTFAYDDQGRLTNVVDMAGLASGFGYEPGDPNNFMMSMTTPYGTTKFLASTSIGLLKATVPAGYRGFSRAVAATDPLGQTEMLLYLDPAPSDYVIQPSDPKPPATNIMVGAQAVSFRVGNENLHFRNTVYLTKRQVEAADKTANDNYTYFQKGHLYHWLVTDRTYQIVGVLESEKPPLESRIWYNYPGQPANTDGVHWQGTNNQPSKIARVLDDGSTQLRQFDYNFLGRITRTVDPVGRTFTYTYATNGVDLLEIRQTRTGNELLMRLAYNSQHLPTNIVDAAGQTNTLAYNARGQLLTRRNPLGHTWTNTYDASGYLIAVDGPLPGTNDVTRYTYDAFGRVRTLTESDGNIFTLAYDNLNRVTNVTYADGTAKVLTYDKLDLAATRDREGRVNTRRYDPLRRLIETVDPLGRTNRFSWCACGSQESFIDPLGRMTRWHYDLEGRLVAKEYADGSQVNYTYEENTSRLARRVDEKGQITQYEYNRDDTRSRVSYPKSEIPTPAVAYTYDTNYNRLAAVDDCNGRTAYTWHPAQAGRLGATKLASVDGPWTDDLIEYGYDAAGRTVTRRVAGALETNTLDALDRLVTASNLLGQFQYQYDRATRRLTNIAKPNGTFTRMTYASMAQNQALTEIYHGRTNGQPLYRFTYQRTPTGMITNWAQQFQNEPPITWAIRHDAAKRLTGVDVWRTNQIINRYAYTYDPADNRLSEVRDGLTNTFLYNAVNEILSSSSPVTPDTQYAWDAENRLISIIRNSEQWQLNVDSIGRPMRLYYSSNGVAKAHRSLIWGGARIAAWVEDGSGVVARFLEEGEIAGGGRQYYHTDHLGSVRIVTESLSSIVGAFDFDPWGRPSVRAGSASLGNTYAGLWPIPSGEPLLAVHRCYLPQTGRWLSRDVVGEIGGHNLFAYVHNSPHMLRDPSGLASEGDSCWSSCIQCLMSLPADVVGVYAICQSGGTLGPIILDLLATAATVWGCGECVACLIGEPGPYVPVCLDAPVPCVELPWPTPPASDTPPRVPVPTPTIPPQSGPVPTPSARSYTF